jgi:REP element-mobilizing transposase RayT
VGVARALRENVEDGLYHAWTRGNRKQATFLTDRDRFIFLSLLGKVVERMEWRLLAYCLMGNHLHLIVETPRGNLSEGMQRLLSRYALGFNQRHDEVGHLFQGRFGANRITTDEQLWAAAAYVARNPVEAGLCERAEDWRWSSHAATIGLATPPAWLDSPRLIALLEAAARNPIELYGGLVRT